LSRTKNEACNTQSTIIHIWPTLRRRVLEKHSTILLCVSNGQKAFRWNIVSFSIETYGLCK